MAKSIHLELEPVYKTNFLLIEMEKENNTSYDSEDYDDSWQNWKHWNQTQKWMPQD